MAPPIDTIAAVATPCGQGAVAIVRLSGPRARPVVESIWKGRPLDPPRRARLGRVVDADGRTIDQVLVTRFQAPASFTGEDVVEIASHGGLLVTRRILDAVLAAGARPAEPGEFTQRAYLNGRIDLTQAEAVMDVITAQTDLALRAANEQLAGRLGERIRALRAGLVDLLAHVEAGIDFPDEDIDPDTGAALVARLVDAHREVAALLETADQGRILREGVRTVIAGPPNAGKSSLLNRLLGFDRAIVSEIAGTTRDTIEEVINLRGLPLRLVDTAGLRDPSDPLEQQGVARSNAALATAGLVLEMADLTLPRDRHPSLETSGRRILLLNKCDLDPHPSWSGSPGIRLSCKSGAGFDELADAIERQLTGDRAHWHPDLVAINARHRACLVRAADALAAARRVLDAGEPFELAAAEVRAAAEAVGDVVGRIGNEEVLDVIFGRFCIGK
jgi:tRNA modification GTPase